MELIITIESFKFDAISLAISSPGSKEGTCSKLSIEDCFLLLFLSAY